MALQLIFKSAFSSASDPMVLQEQNWLQNCLNYQTHFLSRFKAGLSCPVDSAIQLFRNGSGDRTRVAIVDTIRSERNHDRNSTQVQSVE